MTPVRRVDYFAPFGHYLAADWFRVAVAVAAFLLAGIVLRLAHLRWDESRRSATLFLLALVAYSMIFVYAEIHALGHPPTLVLWLLPVPLGLVAWACFMVVGEAKAGIWARRI
jgi:hypothetical protein